VRFDQEEARYLRHTFVLAWRRWFAFSAKSYVT
jgi:hypothetical protein